MSKQRSLLFLRLPVVGLLAAVPWIARAAAPGAPVSAESPKPADGVHPIAAQAAPQPFQIIGSSKLLDLTRLSTGALPQAVANFFFDRPQAFITSGANGKSVAYAVSHVAYSHRSYPLASQTWLFNSYGPNYLTKQPGIRGVFGPGGPYGPGRPNPPGLSVVQYDPEGQASNGTPQAECGALNAGNLGYVRAAIALVHAKRLKFLFSPSVDVGMQGPAGSYPTKYTTWIHQDRGAWAAAGEDFYSIQSQQAEGTPVFASFVAQAIAQSKSAAPQVPVGIGIGINPSNPPTVITTKILMDAYNTGIQDGAAGFWHNVELGVNADVPASIYVVFFNLLYAWALSH